MNLDEIVYVLKVAAPHGLVLIRMMRSEYANSLPPGWVLAPGWRYSLLDSAQQRSRTKQLLRPLDFDLLFGYLRGGFLTSGTLPPTFADETRDDENLLAYRARHSCIVSIPIFIARKHVLSKASYSHPKSPPCSMVKGCVLRRKNGRVEKNKIWRNHSILALRVLPVYDSVGAANGRGEAHAPCLTRHSSRMD